MQKSLADLIHQRSGGRCEYCHDPVPPFHIERIIARKHGGQTTAENLALSCIACNLYKGSNLSGIDAETRKVERLFNPRTERWTDYFVWAGERLVGTTPTGRATVVVLRINDPSRVAARAKLIADGYWRK